MSKVFIISLAINLILGYARAQITQVDMRIGSLNGLQKQDLSRDDDNFKSLVSYSTPAMGRKLYAEKKYSSDHKWNKLNYNNGDLNTSIIKTTYGKTIMVQWDETSPRPY